MVWLTRNSASAQRPLPTKLRITVAFARPRPVQASAGSQCWWHQPKRAGKPEARAKAQRRRPKQSKTLELEVRNSSRTWIEARNASRGPKQAWKPEARIEARSARRSRQRSSKVGILDFDAAVDCKCQEHNSIRKNSQEDHTLFAKFVEFSDWAGFN